MKQLQFPGQQQVAWALRRHCGTVLAVTIPVFLISLWFLWPSWWHLLAIAASGLVVGRMEIRDEKTERDAFLILLALLIVVWSASAYLPGSMARGQKTVFFWIQPFSLYLAAMTCPLFIHRALVRRTQPAFWRLNGS